MVRKIKKQKGSIEMLLKTQGIKNLNLLMFCLIKKLIRHRMKKIQSKLLRIGT